MAKQAKALQTRSALYYPYTEIRNVAWLKWALLYWDHIDRIVPGPQKPTRDQPEVLQALEAGALRNRDCTEDIPAVAEDFLRNFSAYISIAESAESTLIHSLKLGSVAERLVSEGVASRVSERPELRIPKPLAAQTMVRLAQHMSERLQMPVVTDSPDYAKLAEPFLGLDNGLSGDSKTTVSAESTSEFVQRLVVPFFSVDQVAHVSMESILRFREDYRDERRLFVRTINEALMELSAITDVEDYKDAMADEAKRIKVAVKSLALNRKLGVMEQVDSVIQIVAPTLISVAVASGHVPEAVLCGVSGALTATLVAFKTRVKKLRWLPAEAENYQYLMSMKRHMRFRS